MHTRNTYRRETRLRRGFTLLEVIVVVTIIALLATLVAPRLWRQIGGAKQRLAQAEVSSIAQQVKLWMVDNGFSRLPDDFELEMLTEGSDPYLKAEDLVDPWDHTYLIINPGEKNQGDFDIMSLGGNGERGGEGEDADVIN